MKNKLVTIGIPCYNAGKTVAKAVDSVINQSYKNWELITVDDGSKDNSLKEIKNFSDERITVINNDTNKGLPASLNQIANLAKGKYIARMDADDIMFPNRIEKQVEYLEENPTVDLLGSGIICIDGGDNKLGERCPALKIESVYQIFKGEVIYHPTLIGKTEWFKNNPYDESYIRSEDFELWCRTAGNAVIHNLKAPLLYYREYRENTSLKKYLLQSRISRKVILKYGVKKIGFLRTGYLLCRRFIKDVLYLLCKISGFWNIAISKRN